MTDPKPGRLRRSGRRDWVLSAVDGAAVLLLVTLWADTGSDGGCCSPRRGARSPSSNCASLTAATPRASRRG